MYRIPIILAFLVPGAVVAQTAAPTSAPVSPSTQETTPEGALTTTPPDLTTDEKGFLSYIDFNGNSNETGHMFSTGFSLGYQFSRHVSVDAHVPFYYVSASTTATDSAGVTQTTTTTDNGIGDPSFALLLRFPNRTLDVRTRLTTWVPVADINSGFSTGSVLVDWTSQFSRPVGRLLPYGQIGVANTVPDTPLFLLPYTAEGLNLRFEGGTHVLLSKVLSTGASFYYVLPSGNQTLYSRDYHGANIGNGGIGGATGASQSWLGNSNGNSGDNGSGSGNGTGSSSGTGNGSSGGNRFGFLTQQVTEGNDITRDYGLSAWITANLPYFIDVQFGVNRSFDYDLTTFSFGLGFDPIRAFRHRQE
jgi:hypothetical protein